MIRSIRFSLVDDLFLAFSCSHVVVVVGGGLLQRFPPVERDREGGKGRLCVLYDTRGGTMDRGTILTTL